MRHVGAALVVLLTVFTPATTADAHPLHTSLAELSQDRRSGVIHISLKVFADDIEMAARTRSGRASSQSIHEPALVKYARASLTLTDMSGKSIPMAFCGARRSGDLLWVCFRAVETRRGTGIRVMNHVMFDVFDDQINVVSATYAGRKTNLLFTRGDRPAVLR